MKKYTIPFIFLFTSFLFAQNFMVALDAGHGGDDKGVIENGIVEADYNFEMIQLIFEELKKFDWITPIKTRDIDNETVPLKERIEFINNNNVDLLISFHINSSSNPNASGVDAWYPKNHDKNESKRDAEEIVDGLQQFDLKLREIQPGTFKILKETECPGVLLDVGYASNQHDSEILKKKQKLIASAIAKRILVISKN